MTSLTVRAPGRVNLIGEHTDYNRGWALPVAIDLGITIELEPTTDRRVELTTEADGRRVLLDLDALGAPRGDWTDYVAGTAWSLAACGASITGFRGRLASDLPSGAGLSSSAALELAVAWSLGGGSSPLADRRSVAGAAQRAENDYVGVACGLMDQYAVTFGEAGRALLLDCRSMTHRAVPVPENVVLLVIDSGVRRRLAASAYGERRAACDRAVIQIQTALGAGRAAGERAIRTLRDVAPDDLERARSGMDPEAFRRARHVVTENRRVLEAAAALETGDLDALGRLFAASHASLRDDFAVTTLELDRIVEIASGVRGVIGARMTGGGFGGSVVVLARSEAVDPVSRELAGRYRTPAGAAPAIHRVVPSRGVGAIIAGVEAP